MEFTNEIVEYIKLNGRQLSGGAARQSNFTQGFPEKIKSFMLRYGGLEIKKFHSEGVISREVNKIIFDISLTEGLAEGYGKFLSKKLFPIGVYMPEAYEIVVDENEFVYLLGESCFCAGKKLYEGIERIIRADERNMLELDPSNDTHPVWLKLNENESIPVNIDSYLFI